MRGASGLAALALLSAAGAAGAPAPADQVRALEQRWLAAERDPKALETILAPDFRHPVAAGVELDKRQHIAWADAHPSPPDRKRRFERLDVRIYGTTAVANGVVLDTDAAGGDPRRTLFTDVFVRRDGRWQAVNAQENAISPRP